MDYLMLYRPIQCMRDGLEPDIDVYDLASWSVVAELSEIVPRKGFTPDFPSNFRPIKGTIKWRGWLRRNSSSSCRGYWGDFVSQFGSFPLELLDL